TKVPGPVAGMAMVEGEAEGDVEAVTDGEGEGEEEAEGVLVEASRASVTSATWSSVTGGRVSRQYATAAPAV
ncbi:hypothetical protein G3I55_15265, partial [Streptomyces sp. SID6648]|nr:hypothetical protein [Streptomyces sp. SID6648]